jgi:ADP-ribosylglycohydrolase
MRYIFRTMNASATLAEAPPLSLRERHAGLLYGALIGDALALGAHWIYDAPEIARRFGEMTDYRAPDPNGYHPGKVAGDQTHYGDQLLVLMESLEDCGEAFVMEDFVRRWRSWAEESASYKDHATKETLAHLQEGRGLTQAASGSTELGGASRSAPLLVALRGEEQPVILGAMRAQTALTHAPVVIEAAELLARSVFMLLRGVSLRGALQGGVGFAHRRLPAEEYLQRAIEKSTLPVVEAVGEFGASCDMAKALPSSLAILWRLGDDPEQALIQNVMAGGDSAARGMFIGALLGAAHGRRAFPERWIKGLRAGPKVESFFQAVGLGL